MSSVFKQALAVPVFALMWVAIKAVGIVDAIQGYHSDPWGDDD